MKFSAFHRILFATALICLVSSSALAQYKVKGTVYDSSRTYPIEAVTVMSTNGKITLTDTLGHYQIDVGEKDSIWFSFQGKPTPKYPVLKIADVNEFDLALRLKMDVMKEIFVRAHNYKEDSIQNRRDYAKVFNFHRPTIGTMTSIGPMGAGIDLDELIRLFQFRKNRSMLKFQERLEQEEKDKFVDRRFNKILVQRLTGLEGEDLQKFMQRFRPTFEFTAGSSDYDFQLYIKKAAEVYKRIKPV